MLRAALVAAARERGGGEEARDVRGGGGVGHLRGGPAPPTRAAAAAGGQRGRAAAARARQLGEQQPLRFVGAARAAEQPHQRRRAQFGGGLAAHLVERASQPAAVRVGRDARRELSHGSPTEVAASVGATLVQRVRRRRWPRLPCELARRRRRDERRQRFERGVGAQPRLVGVAARRDHKAADELGIARRRHSHRRLERERGFQRLALRLLRAPRRREAGGETSHAVVVKGSSRVGRCMQMYGAVARHALRAPHAHRGRRPGVKERVNDAHDRRREGAARARRLAGDDLTRQQSALTKAHSQRLAALQLGAKAESPGYQERRMGELGVGA